MEWFSCHRNLYNMIQLVFFKLHVGFIWCSKYIPYNTYHSWWHYQWFPKSMPSNIPLVVVGFMVTGWSVISLLCSYIRLPDNCNGHNIYVLYICHGCVKLVGSLWVWKKISYSSDFPLARAYCDAFGIWTKENLVLGVRSIVNSFSHYL